LLKWNNNFANGHAHACFCLALFVSEFIPRCCL
jgi:hypothetical protein